MADKSPGNSANKRITFSAGESESEQAVSGLTSESEDEVHVSKSQVPYEGSDFTDEEMFPVGLDRKATATGFDDGSDEEPSQISEDKHVRSDTESEGARSPTDDKDLHSLDLPDLDKPIQRKKIHFAMGDDSEQDLEHPTPNKRRKATIMQGSQGSEGADVHDMLVELYDLTVDPNGKHTWQETARWIKYEEDAEGLDRHWGKPHVAFLSFHALIQIRKCLTKGLILLDAEGSDFQGLCNLIAAAMKSQFDMDEDKTSAILQTLNRQHRHVHETNTSILPRKMTQFHLSGLERSNSRLQARGSQVSMDTHGRTKSFAHDSFHEESNGQSNGEGPMTSNSRNLSVPSAVISTKTSVSNTSRSMAIGMPPIDKEKKKSFFKPVFSNPRISSATGMDEYDQHELLKRVPENAETAQVFVGHMKELKKVRFAMVRLKNSVCIPELLEAPIPIRFIFVILGPQIPDVDYHELGRSISTLMSNPEFHAEAYHATGRDELVKGVDTFLDGSIVIPPGEIDSKRLFTVDDIKKALRKRARKTHKKLKDHKLTEDKEALTTIDEGLEGEKKSRPPSVSASTISTTSSGVIRTGRPFGGAIMDIRNRLPDYISDFKDGVNLQCVTAIVFMFFASFAPAITFGGLMGDYTGGTMGMMETLIAQCLSGLIWGAFSAQPLMIMSPTGPVLIFEASLYKFCKVLGLDFLVIRVWAGLWVMAIAIVVVAFEGVFLVSYVTPFTEDIFSLLISIIFIAESVKFLKKNFYHHPVMNLDFYRQEYDHCIQPSSHLTFIGSSTSPQRLSLPEQIVTSLTQNVTDNSTTLSNVVKRSVETIVAGSNVNWPVSGPFAPREYHHMHCPILEKATKHMNSSGSWNLTAVSEIILNCCKEENQPDTGLLTAILLITTFSLAVILKKLKTSQFLGKTLRRALSDFGVLIAIFIVTMLDAFLFNKPFMRRLRMPEVPRFTDAIKRHHGLIIPFQLPPELWWGYLFAALPAFLVFILLFVETEITGLLLSKKERGLRKGTGFHWDLLLVALMTFICSVFGLPWMCAAAVQSLAHVNSLSVMNRHAPGEKQTVSHVIEQRVTVIGVSLLIGACTFAGRFLKVLPLAVLFGVFLYLGVMNMIGVQMVQRIVLFFLPRKYFPDVAYCQEVGFWRMHLYTLIQILCLVIIYLTKHFKASSLAFPFVLMLITVFRFFGLPKIFKEKELHALDGHETEYNEEEDLDDGVPIPV